MTQTEASGLVSSYFGSWRSAMVRYATGLLGDLQQAEDLVQDAYIRLYQQYRSGSAIDNPKAWLFRVLRNDSLRLSHSQKAAATIHVSPDTLNLHEERASLLPREGDPPWQVDDVEQFLSVLTKREQEVMILRMSSLKYREIAEHLDLSVSSVNTLLVRAIRKVQAAAREKKEGRVRNVARGTFNSLH